MKLRRSPLAILPSEAALLVWFDRIPIATVIDRLFQIADRLNRLQRTTLFRIVASVASLLAIGGLAATAASGKAAWLPASLVENAASSAAIAALVALGVVWLNQSLTALGLLVLAVPAWALLRATGHPLWAQTALGMALMWIVFLMLLQTARLTLSAPWPPLAIARLVLDEAIRMKLALVFILLLVVFIPFLITQLDQHERLQYRIQTFLSYGTGVSYAILAVMTLFLSTATVAFEQRDKQIFGVATKPVGRFEYLMGKWLGVMTLNLVLLLLVGGSVFWFTQYMRTLSPHDTFDALAVNEQVLAARVGVKPDMPDFARDAWERAAQEVSLEADPALKDNPEAVATRAGDLVKQAQTEYLSIEPGASEAYIFSNVRPVLKRRTVTASLTTEPVIIEEAVRSPSDLRVKNEDGSITYAQGMGGGDGGGQYAIVVGEDATAIFLAPAARQANYPSPIAEGQRLVVEYYPSNALTLRFKINAPGNDTAVTFPMTFGFPDHDSSIVQEVALVQSQTLLIPAGYVSDDGRLTIEIFNGDVYREIAGPSTINFPNDGLELMYKVGSFETNYLRGLSIVWLKLGFLAMLGVAAATFASFPVACLVAFTVFLGAECAPFLSEALYYYDPVDAVSKKRSLLKTAIYGVAYATNWLLDTYGTVRPSKNLVEGRLVPWKAVFHTGLIITVFWTGLAGLVGWWVFRKRQLAIYSGHQ